ncbi:MAG: threonine--tRNA ligase [Verrucomicrobia bacterium]|nr:threonine--tRNA ligase [Verrucomicrobiota bacterium]
MPEDRKSPEARQQMTEIERVRHSCAHVLATAILRIWPAAQFAAGPPVENGFYYDLELDHHISPPDFEQIEAEMRKVIRENQPFDRIVVSRNEAFELAKEGRLGALGPRAVPSKFKLDILRGIPEDEEISLYRNGDFTDLCAGPHVLRTGNIGAFKLTSIASAYYKGDSNNPQLQRVYGTAFKTRTELEQYFQQREEAKKRDHRKLGRELELFHIDDEVGLGLVLWKPKGAIIRKELQAFISEELRKQGYTEVFTPHIGKLALFRTSGHYPYYRESQFPPLIEPDTLARLAEEDCSCAELSNRLKGGEIDGYLLKPMNCPMHIKIYSSTPHSYRDLPIRLAEFGTVYRWEQSGELGGMTRVRGFTQDDAHIFCTEDQVATELQGCLELVLKVLGTLGMSSYRVRIGLRDTDSAKYVGTSAQWHRAEEALRETVKSIAIPCTEERGEAAFYGPKIDFVVKDVIGREWQLGTVQVDYNLPERFGLSYIAADNSPRRPVMIHRAPFGSLERFCGVLIEHFAGNFPLWLAPEQARVLPISARHEEYGRSILKLLLDRQIRATIDESSDKIGAKIRLAQLEKVPYMLVLGAREEQTGEIAVRSRKNGDEGAFSAPEFVERIQMEVKERQRD